MREGQIIAAETRKAAFIIRFPGGSARAPARHGPFYRRLASLIVLWRDRWVARRQIRQLALSGPDWLLKDIGVTREEAWRRARTPFWRP